MLLCQLSQVICLQHIYDHSTAACSKIFEQRGLINSHVNGASWLAELPLPLNRWLHPYVHLYPKHISTDVIPMVDTQGMFTLTGLAWRWAAEGRAWGGSFAVFGSSMVES